MTSNQYYGGLNKRFQKRAKILHKLGFKYQIIVEGLAGFVKPHYRPGLYRNVIASGEILNMSKIVWLDLLKQLNPVRVQL